MRKPISNFDDEDRTETPPWEEPQEDKITLIFSWTECRTEPTLTPADPYKPFSPLLIPSTEDGRGIGVAIEVPKKYILENDRDDIMVLTLDGWAYVQFMLKNVLERYYQKYGGK